MAFFLRCLLWRSNYRGRGLGLVVLIAMLPQPAAAMDRGFDVLVKLYYDVEVLSFCGGSSHEVVAGFSREQRAITQRYGIDAVLDKKARFEAARRADREWNNRGLGGFRHWCRQEGQAAVRRFSTSSPSGRI